MNLCNIIIPSFVSNSFELEYKVGPFRAGKFSGSVIVDLSINHPLFLGCNSYAQASVCSYIDLFVDPIISYCKNNEIGSAIFLSNYDLALKNRIVFRYHSSYLNEYADLVREQGHFDSIDLPLLLTPLYNYSSEHNKDYEVKLFYKQISIEDVIESIKEDFYG